MFSREYIDLDTGEIHDAPPAKTSEHVSVGDPDAYRKLGEAQRKEYRLKRRLEAKRCGKPSVPSLRFAQLNRLLRDRYPAGIPETEDPTALEILTALANHRAFLPGAARSSIAMYLNQATWLSEDERCERIDAIAKRPWIPKAETLGKNVQLTEVERCRLRITNICSIDGPSARERNRRDQERFRRRCGARPRAEYEADARSKRELCEELGISLRTYYRRQASLCATCSWHKCPWHKSVRSNPYLLPVTDLCRRSARPRQAAIKAAADVSVGRFPMSMKERAMAGGNGPVSTFLSLVFANGSQRTTTTFVWRRCHDRRQTNRYPRLPRRQARQGGA